MDRRRWTSLLVVAIAATASIATSAVEPTPPPTVSGSATGSVELSAEHPLAIRAFKVHVVGLQGTSSGPNQRASARFSVATSGIEPGVEGAGDVRISVVRAEPDRFVQASNELHSAASNDGSWMPDPDLTCDGQGTCEGRFALIFDAVHLTAAKALTVGWELATQVELWTATGGTEATKAEVTVDEPTAEGADAKAPAVTFAEASGEGGRLDLKHRLTMWHLSLKLDDKARDAPPSWPLIVTARLQSASTVVGPVGAELLVAGKDSTPLGGDSGDGGPIEFEPAWACVSGDSCTAEYIVGVALYDHQPETALDVGWKLDIRAIAADGRTVPVEAVAEPIAPMPMISATLSGRFVVASDPPTDAVYYTVAERVGSADRDPKWDGLDVPRYAILRTRMSSTGSVLPAEGWDVSFSAPDAFLSGLTPGVERVDGFTPDPLDRACRVPRCVLSSYLNANVNHFGTPLPQGWQITIDWELEVGMGTSAINGDSTLLIETGVPTPP